MYFGNNLKILLKRVDTTQTSLAKRLNVGNSTVSAWISGNSNPEVATVLEIRKILGVDLERLFFHDFSQEMNPSYSLELNEAAEPQTDYAITKVFEPLVGDVQGSGCSMSADGSCMFKNLAKLNEAMKENEELKRRMAVLERQAKRKK